MIRLGFIVAGAALAFGLQVAALAQAAPDLSGTWVFNQAKSGRGTAGNSPTVPFPSQLLVKQSPTELTVSTSTPRQADITAVYKLDGSKVAIAAPAGISETGAAKFEGANLVIASRRSFPSPAGEIVVEFKETWRLEGNALAIEKTRISDGESVTEKAIFEKK